MLAPFVLYVLMLLNDDACMTWYGNEFVGRHHAAHWHGQTPPGFSDTVQPEEFGVAAPITVPFGTRLRFTRLDDPTLTVEAVVVDRMRDFHNPQRYDAYPAVAEALGFGPAFGPDDVGVIRVRVEVIEERNFWEHVSLPSIPERVVGTVYSDPGFFR